MNFQTIFFQQDSFAREDLQMSCQKQNEKKKKQDSDQRVTQAMIKV
jgi:5-methylcytosine-specific restriction endonuclease McrA